MGPRKEGASLRGIWVSAAGRVVAVASSRVTYASAGEKHRVLVEHYCKNSISKNQRVDFSCLSLGIFSSAVWPRKNERGPTK
jgi:hypothetical protein